MTEITIGEVRLISDGSKLTIPVAGISSSNINAINRLIDQLTNDNEPYANKGFYADTREKWQFINFDTTSKRVLTITIQ